MGPTIVQNIPKDEKDTPRIVLSLPYIPKVSEAISRSWHRCSKILKKPINTAIAYKPVNKLRSTLCNLYDKTNDRQGVYRATCGTCSSFYIGETSLLLKSRIASHKQRSSNSAVRKHETTSGHKFDDFKWEMITTEANINKRMIKEAFVIKEERPDLNRMNGVDFYTFIDWFMYSFQLDITLKCLCDSQTMSSASENHGQNTTISPQS